MIDVLELLVTVPIVFLAWSALELTLASGAVDFVERTAKDLRRPRYWSRSR